MRLQVIGDPVLHSLSPKIHGAMLRELGLDIPYDAHVVQKGGLPGYLVWARDNGVAGFNATMPHKEDLIPLLDDLGEDAARFGAVNTVCLRDGKWIGHNTDGEGCLAALKGCGMCLPNGWQCWAQAARQRRWPSSWPPQARSRCGCATAPLPKRSGCAPCPT